MNTAHQGGCVRESELIKKVATATGLELKPNPDERGIFLEFQTKNVGRFPLSKNFVKALAEEGFTFGPGEGHIRKGMIYLSSNSKQSGEIFESDCWAWERSKVRPRLDICFNMRVNEKERGVFCVPDIWGNCSGGACHQPTIDAFVRVVSKHFSNAHPLIKQAAEVDSCRATISWHSAGLAGVKSVGELFKEWFGENKKVMRLAQSKASPFFNPNPFEERVELQAPNRLFVLESHHRALFSQWKKQLSEFATGLA